LSSYIIYKTLIKSFPFRKEIRFAGC